MTNKPLDRFSEALRCRGSVLCLGLDPDPSLHTDTAKKLSFCLDVLDNVSEFSSAVKVNENFVRDFSLSDHRKLTAKAHETGLVTIYDCKMGDIENSVKAGIHLVAEMGYDFITFNPFLGTLHSAVKHGRNSNVGIIVLLHPSNPESEKYFRAVLIHGKLVYETVLEEAVEAGADGVVVGLHPKVTSDSIRRIRNVVGEDKMMLFPGVGVQGGDLEAAVIAGGEKILVNVGRSIIYAPSPKQAAQSIFQRIQDIRRQSGKNI